MSEKYKKFYEKIKMLVSYKSSNDNWTDCYEDVCDYVEDDNYVCGYCGYSGVPVVMCTDCECCNDVHCTEGPSPPKDSERMCPYCDYHGFETTFEAINEEIERME